jgi:RNA polymerase sigma factor (sigma-70 family)
MINVGRAMRGFSYDRSRGRFRAYLGRAVQNAVSRFLAGRHAGIRFADLDAASTAASEPEDERWLDEWRSHHLHLALETLKASVEPRSLQVFERLLDGSTAAEIATSFGMSEEAVHKVRQRMRDRLRDLVVEQVRDEESGQSDAQ